MEENIERVEIYHVDGTVEVREIVIEQPTIQTQIADKEVELLRIYEEIQLLKNGN
jgi:hypothetical protein